MAARNMRVFLPSMASFFQSPWDICSSNNSVPLAAHRICTFFQNIPQ